MANSLDQIRLHDLKVELLIAELLEFNEFDILPVNLSLSGQFNRSESKEIISNELKFDVVGDEYEDLELCREGIYDGLPLFISHVITKKQQESQRNKNSKSLTESIKEEEQSTRKFFNPFEQEIYRYRGQVLKDEMEFNISLESFREYLSDLTGDGDESNLDILIPLLPVIYGLKGDLRKFIDLLAEKFGIRATVKTGSLSQVVLDEQDEIRLGEYSLGHNFVIDSRSADFIQGVTFEINQSDLTHKQSAELKKKVHFLADLALPADVLYNIDISVLESLFILSDNPDYCPILGYNTIL